MCDGQSRVYFKAGVLLEGQQVCWCWARPVAWRECWHGGVVKSVNGQWMEGKRASGVGGIVTWLWWLVFGPWCPHTLLLIPIHSLAHAFVASFVVDRVIGWRGVVWVE